MWWCCHEGFNERSEARIISIDGSCGTYDTQVMGYHLSKKGRYEIFKGEDDQWYFNRVAGNGQIEHPSEGYSTKGNAVRAIGTCMADTSHYEIKERKNDD